MAGRLLRGEWTVKDDWEADSSGEFKRQESVFRRQLKAPEAGRYHLFISYACPWAHRTLIVRALMGLDSAISMSCVHPILTHEGWHFAPEDSPFACQDPLHGEPFLRHIYTRAKADYSGRVTVPVLWDKRDETIINNESAEVIRQLATVFTPLATTAVDLYPEALRPAIDAAMDAIYTPINNGVYRCGFAQSAEAYQRAYDELFAALDHWDALLAQQAFLTGDTMTIADVAMFTTLIRFDAVYYVHFKTCQKHIYEYPNLWRFVRQIYRMPGVKETVKFDHIKTHYFASHRQLNPRGFVPQGPDIEALLS